VLRDGLGDQFEPVMQALRHRAPVFLRANLGQVSRDEARAALSAEGIVTQPHPLANSALEVTENARKIQSSQAFANGFVELQDASSQAVVELLPLRNGMRVLDYCAGGGGKTLAMAARAHLTIFAHDANPTRMRDLPARAARAGCPVQVLKTAEVAQSGPFDLVLADVPCSGSGSWRRAPEAKWTLTADGLAKLTALQAEILGRTAALVGPNGTLAYVTCSMIAAENGRQVAAFLAARPDWQMVLETGFSPLSGGDGFYLALLARRRTGVSA
jgi:16S rRNA (cytosine967-C5)-methyltransferase